LSAGSVAYSAAYGITSLRVARQYGAMGSLYIMQQRSAIVIIIIIGSSSSSSSSIE